MSRSTHTPTSGFTARWKRSAAMLAAATTVVATAGLIAPLAAQAANTSIGLTVTGQPVTRPYVSFTNAAAMFTVTGLATPTTGQESATLTQTAQSGQPTGYKTYGTGYSTTAPADASATAGQTAEKFDLDATALPAGYYDVAIDDATGNPTGDQCTRCLFVIGDTPTLTGLSKTAVAGFATVGSATPTASTTQFALKGTDLSHAAAVTFDNPGISFKPGVGTSYTDEGASGLTVRYGQLIVGTRTNPVKAGTYHLTVTDADGGQATIAFTVDTALVVTSIYPTTVGNSDTGRLIHVIGTGLTNATTFASSISGTANPVTNPATTIVAKVQAVSSDGTQAVVAVTVGATEESAADSTNGMRTETLGASNTDSGADSTPLLVTGASPTISAVTTAGGVSQTTPGSGAQTLTITGTNFVTGAKVAFRDAAGQLVTGITTGAATFNSATSLTVPATFTSAAATQVDAPTVTNPDGGIGTCATSFSGATVVPASCFQVATYVISSTSAPIKNDMARTIAFTGTGFTSASTFTAQLIANPAFAGQPAISSTSCTTAATSTATNSAVTCTFPTTLAAPVNYDVLFSRTTGSTVDSDTDANAVPILNATTSPSIATTGVSPLTITGADLARTVTLTGAGFANAVKVTSTETDLSFGVATVTSATSLTVPVILAQGAKSGTGTLKVTNADNQASGASTQSLAVGTEPTVTAAAMPTNYTIGNTGFSVPVLANNTAAGNQTLMNEQARLTLTGLTGLTPGQVSATVNNVAVTAIAVGSAVVVPSPAFTATNSSTTEGFVVKLLPGAPSGNLNITPALGDALGTPAYPSTTTPDTQAMAGSFAVAVAGPPPTLSTGSYPTQLVVGDPAVSQTLTVINNSGTRLNEGQLDISVTGPAGLTPSQVVVTSTGLQSTGATQTTTANPVALTFNNGLKGVLAAAQIIPSGSTYTSTVTLALASGAPLGAYSLVYSLDSTDQNGTPSTPPAGTTFPAPLTQAEQGVGIPTAPTSLVITPGNGALMIVFGAPTSDGGDGPLTYKITATAAGQPTVSVTAAASPVVLTGLANGVAYNVFVQAENAVGRFGAVVNAVATPIAGSALPPTLSGIRAVTASLSKAFAPLGTRVTLSGKLTIGGLAVPGAPVTIQTTYSDGKVVQLGTVVTKADGTYSYTFEPLYNGYLKAISGSATSKPVGSRVIVIFSRLTVSHSGNTIKVLASTAPGFVTSPKRLERAQILLVDGSGRIVKVLAVVNAANRHGSPGQAHGVNDVAYSGKLPAGSYRIAVKIIGTPVNTGAQSGSKSVRIS